MQPKTRSRLAFIAILSLSIAPIVAAQWLWQRGDVAGGKTYGQLLAQAVMPAQSQWQLAAHDAAGCTPQATQLSHAAQQLQKSQGREGERLAIRPACHSALPAQFATGIYLIDPHGNAVIYYTKQQLADVAGRQKIIREIGQILKNNRGLG